MRRKERDKMNTLEEIKNTIVLLRDDPCKVSSLLAYRQCKYCPFAVDIDGNGVHRCFERAFIHQPITAQPEVITLTDGWEITVRHVRLLQ